MKAVKLVRTKDMSRADWLEWRNKGLGGSDVSAIAGVNKYKSPLVLYMEKKKLYEREVNNDSAYFGNVMEPVLRKEFVKRINAEREEEGKPTLQVRQCNYLLQHPEHEFLLGNVDGIVHCPIHGKGILEIKTASEYLKDEWEGEDIPNAYYLQVCHYLAITGLSYAYVAVLLGGNKYKHYFVERDEEMIDSVVMIADNFWRNHILTNIPPVASGNDAEADMFKELYPGSIDEPIIEMPIEFKEIAENYESYKEQEKEIVTLKKEARNKIAFELKENALAFAGPHQISYKANKKGVKSLKIKINNREGVTQ